MKIADILRTLAANLEHAQGGAPDPRVQNPAQLIDVAVVDSNSTKSPNGTTPSGNDKAPEVFMPPLQQKQELLKKAVGVENVYDDGGPVEQDEADKAQEQEDTSTKQQDIVDRVRQLSGVPKAAIQELSNDDIVDD